MKLLSKWVNNNFTIMTKIILSMLMLIMLTEWHVMCKVTEDMFNFICPSETNTYCKNITTNVA